MIFLAKGNRAELVRQYAGVARAVRKGVYLCRLNPVLLYDKSLYTLYAANPYKDKNGHYTSKDNNNGPCNHNGGRGNNYYRQKGTKRHREKKAYVLPSGFKPVSISDAYKRIGDGNSETITASDGKKSIFNNQGPRHFKNKPQAEKIKRLQSLDVAQDTVKTGDNFQSYIPGTKVPQTEFIKDYGNKFYYTARRNDSNVVYSWHELEEWQFNKKIKAMNAYKKTGIIRTSAKKRALFL